ncbi:hypothetical protein D9M72_353120 [compost metagenome]
MHAVQAGTGARGFFLQFEDGAQVGRVMQFLVFFAGRRHVAVAPGAHVRRQCRELRTRGPVDPEARGEDQEVQREHALGRGDADFVVHQRQVLDACAQVEAGVGVARDAQRAAARRRHLGGVDVVADLPLPFVGQGQVAVGQSGVARALALVDAGDVVAADQQVHAGGARFQRGGRAVHGRRARAHHAHALARERGVVHDVGRMRPAVARQLLREVGHIGAAQAVAAGGQHHAARQHRAGPGGRFDVELHQLVGARQHGPDAVFVAHVQFQHAAVPAQVIHPLKARDLVQRFPGLGAELRFEPGAEGQRGQAQRGAGQLLGRTQRFHPGRGGPGAFIALGRLVEDGRIDAQVLERRRRRQAGHAAADDGHVQHLLAVDIAGRHPVLGGDFQPRQVLPQARFQRGETLRRGGYGQIHNAGDSVRGASSP